MALATLTCDLIAYRGVNRDPSYLMQFDEFFRMSYTLGKSYWDSSDSDKIDMIGRKTYEICIQASSLDIR